MKNPLPVRPTMCATCPFRPDSPHAHVAQYLSERAMEEARICHSTGDSVFYGRTGKPEAICRGTRDIQLKVMHALGVIDAPTDEAWSRAWEQRKGTGRCDWEVRREKPGAQIVFEECGRPGTIQTSGPEWQRGRCRCKKHAKK